MLSPDHARIALALSRLTAGGGSLLVPDFMARRFGIDPEANRAALYVLRLFGVRTVILGAELLLLEGDRRDQALRLGVWIHVADATAAVIAGIRQQLPRRAAAMATLVSSTNALLAVLARRQPLVSATE